MFFSRFIDARSKGLHPRCGLLKGMWVSSRPGNEGLSGEVRPAHSTGNLAARGGWVAARSPGRHLQSPIENVVVDMHHN
jgi:hypothetical protein